ncbi:MAG TPA: DUF4124 domain-containing protein [Desulfobacterales bacterium]
MTKWICCAVGICFLLGFAGTPSAEFYKYVDEQGNIHFTDDFNKVPIDQREGVQGYVEAVTESPEPDGAPGDASEASESSEGAADQKQDYSFDQKMSELNQRKTELTSEYEALMEENKQLKEMRQSIKTKEEADKYNESVRSLNERLKEHDQKRKAFYSEVEDYNKRVSEVNRKALNEEEPKN